MPPIQGGVWPAMLTPVTEAGEPNLEVLDELVEVLVGEGLDGLYVLGSTGQGPSYSVEARKQIAERTLKAAKGRLPVIVHVGCVATQDSVELAQHAASCGADGISSVPPIYYAAGANAVFMHYDMIGGATDLPFFPYHHTMFGEAALADPSYTDRLMKIPNIAGMKVTLRDLFILGVIHQRTGGALQLFSGADELICHATLSGSAGAIGTFYNIWGPACRRARNAVIAGEFDYPKRFMATFQSALDRLIQAGSMPSFIRAAMRLKYNIDIGPGRTSLSLAANPIDDGEVRKLLAEVDSVS